MKGLTVNIQKKLGDFQLDISFSSDAKRIGILGPSGCGKSMTLKSIAGIEQPDQGLIEIGTAAAGSADSTAAGSGTGRVLYDSSRKINLKPQKRNVGYMFQNYALFPTMTVVQNIAAGLKLSASERDERVREMIGRFHLQGLEKHLPGELSGGQQQRVALARIMAYRPDLILLDEPFSALDQHLKERLQHEMLAMLEDYQGQVVMVSHSRDEIYRFSEELLIMDNGSVLARGETLRLFGDPGTRSVAAMTGCKNFSAAQRLDSHTLRLTDWGTDLHMQREVPADTVAIGYRAHFFEPVWGPREENCIPFRLSGFDELPFERRYYIVPDGPAAKAGAAGQEAQQENPAAGAASSELQKNPAEAAPSAGAASWELQKNPAEAAPAAGATSWELQKNTAAEITPAAGAVPASELICWFVQDNERRALDERPAPDYLRLREDAVLFLHEDAPGDHGQIGGTAPAGTATSDPAPVPSPTLW